MIFSKKHKFLFIKGIKVGGTSFEVGLSNICGKNDIITPVTPIDEIYRIKNSKFHCQNFDTKTEIIDSYLNKLKNLSNPNELAKLTVPYSEFYNHMSLRELKRKLGSEVDDMQIFMIARSPYQYLISLLNHKVKIINYKESGERMQSDISEMKKQIPELLKLIKTKKLRRNIDIYRLYDGINTDNVNYLSYENLENEFKKILERFNIAEDIKLPFLKEGLHSNEDFIRSLFNINQINMINEYFHEEFEVLKFKPLNIKNPRKKFFSFFPIKN